METSQVHIYQVSDTSESIMDSFRLINKVGTLYVDISVLRPKGAPISTTRGTTNGPLSLIEGYNAIASHHKQYQHPVFIGIQLHHPDYVLILQKYSTLAAKFVTVVDDGWNENLLLALWDSLNSCGVLAGKLQMELPCVTLKSLKIDLDDFLKLEHRDQILKTFQGNWIQFEMTFSFNDLVPIIQQVNKLGSVMVVLG